MALTDAEVEEITKLVRTQVADILKAEFERLQSTIAPGIVVRNVGEPIGRGGLADAGLIAASGGDNCCNGCD